MQQIDVGDIYLEVRIRACGRADGLPDRVTYIPAAETQFPRGRSMVSGAGKSAPAVKTLRRVALRELDAVRRALEAHA